MKKKTKYTPQRPKRLFTAAVGIMPLVDKKSVQSGEEEETHEEQVKFLTRCHTPESG